MFINDKTLGFIGCRLLYYVNIGIYFRVNLPQTERNLSMSVYSGAEVSQGHSGTGAEVSQGHSGTSAEVSLRHFGTIN